MADAPQMTDAYDWQGRTLVDSNDDKIGKIDEIYIDNATDQPEWALVNTGLFGTKSNFVPLSGASPSGEDVKVTVTKDQVKDAPGMDPDGELSSEEEQELYKHYSMDFGDYEYTDEDHDADVDTDRSTTGHDTSGPETDQAMTRSEEELAVGIRSRESGRVRLRKYVVTEDVTQTVPVQREEVRIEREPITDANAGDATDGPGISEEEHEVVLHKEEVVSEKRTVPKERVRLDKDTVTEEEQVSEEVRKEQIEVDGDASSNR